MKRHYGIPMVLILALVLASCTTSVTTTARQSAHESLLATAKSFDLGMTLLGHAYQAGVFGAPGSPQAENVRTQASKASLTVSSAVLAGIAALEIGQDASTYIADITKAIAQITALLPTPKKLSAMTSPSGHAALHNSPAWRQYVRLNGGVL